MDEPDFEHSNKNTKFLKEWDKSLDGEFMENDPF